MAIMNVIQESQKFIRILFLIHFSSSSRYENNEILLFLSINFFLLLILILKVKKKINPNRPQIRILKIINIYAIDFIWHMYLVENILFFNIFNLVYSEKDSNQYFDLN